MPCQGSPSKYWQVQMKLVKSNKKNSRLGIIFKKNKVYILDDWLVEAHDTRKQLMHQGKMDLNQFLHNKTKKRKTWDDNES